MCQIQTQLSYGTLIHCFDIAVAARAYSKLVGPLRALHLITLRQRRGSLSTQANGSRKAEGLQLVPMEVWDMVKAALVSQELKTAEVGELESFRCDRCVEAAENAQVCTECPGVGQEPSFKRWEQPDCDHCFENLMDWTYDGRKGIKIPNTLALLDWYGLTIKHTIDQSLVGNTFLNFNAAHVIGRLLPSTEPAARIDSDLIHPYSDPPSTLYSHVQVPSVLPDPSTDARLQALIAYYQLPLSNVEVPTFPGQHGGAVDARGKGRWMIFTTCSTCQ